MRLLVDGKELDFDPTKLLNVEVIAITKATGIAFADFGEQLKMANFELITAIVWVLRKRSEPTLRLADVVFPVGGFSLVDDEVEDEAGPKASTSVRATTRNTSRSSRGSSGTRRTSSTA